eukprot:TRINITY_DN1964_c0_g1_i1.p1 TRINITY_DN1964_c0_g1~~TRINITY_DN1964_c0_g1_i1.p1  ORF type:complete len:1544 (+),score=369.79 TRINITY_DN1964_c0_g1_i1:684-4634(+)
MSEDDPLDRANAVIENLGKCGLNKDFQNYDIVYGEDDIHIQIVAAIATLAATLRLKQLKAPEEKELEKPVVESSKPVELAKPLEPPKPAEPLKPVELPKPVEVSKPVQVPKPVEISKPGEESKPVQVPKPEVKFELPMPRPEVKVEAAKPEEIPRPVVESQAQTPSSPKIKIASPVIVVEEPRSDSKPPPSPKPIVINPIVIVDDKPLETKSESKDSAPGPLPSPRIKSKLTSVFIDDPIEKKDASSTSSIDVGGTADTRILQSVLDGQRGVSTLEKPLSLSDDEMVVISPHVHVGHIKTESDREDSERTSEKVPAPRPQPIPIVVEVPKPVEHKADPAKPVDKPFLVNIDPVRSEEKKEDKPLEVKVDKPLEGKKIEREPSESAEYNAIVPRPEGLVSPYPVARTETDNEDDDEAGDVTVPINSPQTTDGDTGHTIRRKLIPAPNDPQEEKKYLQWGILLTFFFAVLFLILGSVATTVANSKITEYITTHSPIRSSTGTLTQFKTRDRTRNFYVFSYENVDSFSSSSPLKLTQYGPIKFSETVYAYNTSFQSSEFLSPSKKVLKYMERSQLTMQDVNTWKSKYVTIPSIYYVGAISGNYFSNFIDYIPSAVTKIHAYFNGTAATILSKSLIPSYMQYVMRITVNRDSLASSWAAGSSVTLTDGKVFPALEVSIAKGAVDYVFDETTKYTIMRKSLSSSNGVLAWLSTNYDSAITADLVSVKGLTSSEAQVALYIIRDWLKSLVTYSDFLYGVKSQLVYDSQLSQSESASINSTADLGIYQFAAGKLISYLSSSSNTSIVDATQAFSASNFTTYEPYELQVYLNMYSSSSGITIAQAKQFLSVFSSSSYVGSFLSTISYESFSSFTGTYLSNITACGINSTSAEAFGSYLKHLGKMYYFYQSGLGISRDNPPSSVLSKGLFIKISVYDLLMGYTDPNLASNISDTSTYPNPIVKSYDSDAAHWSSHSTEWNQIRTGTDDTSSVYKAVQVGGSTAIRGVWSSKEKVSSFHEEVGIEPFHKSAVLSSFSKWDSKIARAVTYSSSGTSTYNQFTVYRYKPSSSTFQNETTSSGNSKYYMSGPSGVANMANYYHGGDFWISKPHFLDGDSSLTSSFVSGTFTPSDSSHNSYVDVETWSGSIMQGADRTQLNVRLRKKDWMTEPGYTNLFSGRSSDLYLPVYWVDESFSIPSSKYTDMYNNIYKWQQGSLIFTIVFLIAGILLFCAGLYLVFRWTKLLAGGQKLTPKQLLYPDHAFFGNICSGSLLSTTETFQCHKVSHSFAAKNAKVMKKSGSILFKESSCFWEKSALWGKEKASLPAGK